MTAPASAKATAAGPAAVKLPQGISMLTLVAPWPPFHQRTTPVIVALHLDQVTVGESTIQDSR